jgi:DNA invertase Pin-like site-specific DNA recombinase
MIKNNHKIVAIYGRVSTEHESQLSALENQMEWYDNLLNQHPEWKLYKRYIDEGLTATSTKKRQQFLQMIDDAKNECFDLIITREVSRFARNTVDTLQHTRELKKYNVEVFFAEDNIWTMDGDGELRLTIMATLAQDESRKISNRVKAGQASSRRNGVLYGNGNILGYDRVNGTYVINEKQAESVKNIFNLYAEGLGIRKIATKLEMMNMINSINTTKWYLSTVQRVLANTIYFGYITYCKTFSTDFLDQTRKTNFDDKKKIIQKVDIPPIIDKELWDKCYNIRNSKTMPCNNEDKLKNKYGYKKAKCVWLNKLRCNCGSSFRKNKWRRNKDGINIFGYQCYNQVQNGNVKFREDRGLDTSSSCDVKMVAEWKLNLMAKYIFETLWKNKTDIIKQANIIINENMEILDYDNYLKSMNKFKVEIDKNQERINNLIELRVDGEINKNEFNSRKEKYVKTIEDAQRKIDCLDLQYNSNAQKEQLKKIETVLSQDLYYDKDIVNEDIVDALVDKIIVKGNDVFDWYLTLDNDIKSLKIEGNKNGKSPIYVHDSTGSIGTKIGYLPMLTFMINPNEIKAFKNSYGSHAKVSICEPLSINVLIR